MDGMGERIPEDIRAKADEIARLFVAPQWKSALVAMISSALVEERERCAKIAAEVELTPAIGWSEQEASWWETGQNDAALAIASHIRS